MAPYISSDQYNAYVDIRSGWPTHSQPKEHRMSGTFAQRANHLKAPRRRSNSHPRTRVILSGVTCAFGKLRSRRICGSFPPPRPSNLTKHLHRLSPLLAQIHPHRILPFNQPDLLSARPSLQLLLPGNRIPNIGMPLKPHQPIAVVPLRIPFKIGLVYIVPPAAQSHSSSRHRSYGFCWPQCSCNTSPRSSNPA